MVTQRILPLLSIIWPLFKNVRTLRTCTLLQKQTSAVASFFCRDFYLPAVQQKQIEHDKDRDYKVKLISLLNLKSPEDATPFLSLPIKTLIHIYKTTTSDNKQGYCQNRLYYLANNLKCSPKVLSNHIARRTFVYTLSFQWLKSSLDVLLEMGVPTDRIIRDLWVLKYYHKTIHQRLQQVKDHGIDTLFPWMVRCSEEILIKYIETTQETKDILKGDRSTLSYLAERLNTAPEDVEKMSYKMPSLKTIRATKIKHFMDFLISEGFEVEDIASKPRILSASPKTVKHRLDLLRELGLKDINLNVLCRSRKDFKKYLETVESSSKERL